MGDEDVNQTLQWFHVLLWEQVVVHGDSHEVYEAAVELQMPIDVPEWIVPVAVIKMSIASEHLLDDALDVGVVVRWKARGFADPFGRHSC